MCNQGGSTRILISYTHKVEEVRRRNLTRLGVLVVPVCVKKYTQKGVEERGGVHCHSPSLSGFGAFGLQSWSPYTLGGEGRFGAGSLRPGQADVFMWDISFPTREGPGGHLRVCRVPKSGVTEHVLDLRPLYLSVVPPLSTPDTDPWDLDVPVACSCSDGGRWG